MKAVVKEYDENTIFSIEGLDAIRKRPTMYIQSIGPAGVHKIFLEIFANSLDEFNAGRCTIIDINVDTKENTIEVIDNGAGIPLGKLKDILTKLHTGGKFDITAYSYSAGLNGIGIKATNALSEIFIVDVYRENKHAHCEYSRGKELSFKIEDYKSNKQGTRIFFKPDIEVFKEITIDRNKLINTVEIMASVNPGVIVNLTIDGKKSVYNNKNGISDYLKEIIKRKHISAVTDPLYFYEKDEKNKMEIHVAFTYASNVNHEFVLSYVNGIQTLEHGYHVTGVRSGLTEVMKKFITSKNLLPKNLEITGDDVRENLVAVVLAKHNDPLFDGQTKEKFTSQEVAPFARSLINSKFNAWCNNNPEEASKIAKLVIRAARVREATKEAKDKIIKSGTVKSTLFNGNPKKFIDCKSNDPAKRELFIVEGDSAGGSVSQGRNSEFQAVYKLKGKILNVVKKNNKLTDEQKQLVSVLGCGIGDDFNINKLRFHKIIFLTDADSDGGHITALLSGFFFTLFKPLIEMGYVYVGKPPLYRIMINGKPLYIANDRHFELVTEKITTELFDLVGPKKNVKLPVGLFRTYIHNLGNYYDYIQNLAIQLNLKEYPELVELIVLKYDELLKKDKKAFKNLGFDISFTKETSKSMHIEIDKGYDHFCVVLDKNFLENVYYPVMGRLAKIYLLNVFLKSKKTGKIYGGLPYYNAKILNEILKNKNFYVTRFKGLGEMNPEELKRTALDPDTRYLYKMYIGDEDDTIYTLDVYLGKNVEDKKKMFSDEE